ncbi:hypothetical protein RSAG8_07788, partial [Rhizoctonia solani AG-8 WAC10335]
MSINGLGPFIYLIGCLLSIAILLCGQSLVRRLLSSAKTKVKEDERRALRLETGNSTALWPTA